MATTDDAPTTQRDDDSNSGEDNITELRQRFKTARMERSPPASPTGRKTSTRTESLRTDSSSFEARPFTLRHSTEDLLSPRAAHEHDDDRTETSLWYSIPLILAIVPAIGGLAFKGGSVLFTDFTLLGLASIYLNWFLVAPWTWYNSARSIHVIEPLEDADVAIDDPLEVDDKEHEEMEKPTKDKSIKHSKQEASTPKANAPKASSAIRELHIQEILALLMCFAGPALGAYLLHVVRGSLSELGHQLISDLNLMLFVLGAEIRPLRHAMKLVHARTLHLQRVIREDSRHAEPASNAINEDLSRRLEDIEASVAGLSAQPVHESAAPTPDNTEQFKKGHSALQTQIDALNRAVRRYEKRATAQTMQTEGRLQDLEVRLKDALSLAAVAATYAQKPGLISTSLHQTAHLFTLPLRITKVALSYSLALLDYITSEIMVRFGFGTTTQNSSKQYGGKVANYSASSRRYKS